MKVTSPVELPIYERVVARYPHLAHTSDPRQFCEVLLRLAAPETVTCAELFCAASVANGGEWQFESRGRIFAK